MRFFVLFLSFYLFVPITMAHNINVKGYNNEKSNNISSCNGKYYGYHKKNGQNHWHEVVFKDNKWQIINPDILFNSDPCLLDYKIEVDFVRCIDGDTAVFKMREEELKFRFLAIDTPESVHPTKEVEKYAKEASKNTCNLLTNASSISVEFDSNSDKIDKYGRYLVWVWIDNILLQKMIISEGFARVAYIYGDYKYLDSLCSLQSEAINNNKGIWQYDYDIGYCQTKINSIDQSLSSKKYKVTFKNNEVVTEIEVAEGTTVKETDAERKIGYQFVGWYYDDNKFDFNTPIYSNITLVAKYKIDYLYFGLIFFLLIGIASKVKGEKNGKNNQKGFKSNRKKRI